MNFNDALTTFVDALPGMNRVKAVQRALAGRTAPVYLEIGVSKGLAFRKIKADVKIAVDPAFRMSDSSRAQADAGGSTHYFETTSDDFFAGEADLLERRPVDVALIDGLHTYEQVVRDVENTLRYLRDDGVIFLHDCNPPFELASRRADSWEDFIAQQKGRLLVIGIWNGDVWKSIVHLRSTRPDLRVGVLNCDQGVGVVCKGTPDSTLAYSPEQIAALTYDDLKADRRNLLNLTPARGLDSLMGAATGSAGR